MYRTLLIHTSFQKNRWLPNLLLLVGFFCAMVGAIAINIQPAYADSRPGGNVSDPVVRAVDIAKPAVVRILTTTSGHIVVEFAANNKVQFPQESGKNYQLQLSGSGTFISQDGDILTADHVVNPPDQVLQEAAADDIAAYINKHPETGHAQTTSDAVLKELASGQLKSTATFDLKTSEVFLSTDYTGPLSATSLQNIPDDMHATVDKIKKESTFDQKDVAIVHAPFKDTPGVQLGDSSTVQQQDELTIIGFPGNGDVSIAPNNLFTSSVNKITVSSIKTTDNGAELIQVGGNVEHGDSGGPALDSDGNVVGIVSFGLENGGGGGTSFLQASNSARDFVRELNLDTTPGPFQKQWAAAFNSYSSNTPGHWHTAQQQMEQIAKSYPQFKAITPYLNYAKQQASLEKVATPQATATGNKSTSTTPASTPFSLNSIPLIGWIAAAALLVLLVALIGFGAFFRRKGKQQKQAKAVPAQQAQVQAAARSQNASPSTQKGTAHEDGMAAFGAPPKQQPPAQIAPPQQSVPPVQRAAPPPNQGSASTLALRVWPCGHMNRPTARFCSICGEQAPSPTARRVEQ